jgi:hypothetical protein
MPLRDARAQGSLLFDAAAAAGGAILVVAVGVSAPPVYASTLTQDARTGNGATCVYMRTAPSDPGRDVAAKLRAAALATGFDADIVYERDARGVLVIEAASKSGLFGLVYAPGYEPAWYFADGAGSRSRGRIANRSIEALLATALEDARAVNVGR